MKKHIGTFLYAVLAGICIGLGGTVFLRIKDAFPGGTVVGALLFAIGLFAICTRGYNLFTGKACYIFDNKPSYLGSLAVIWVGNLAGTSLLAAIERLTAICGTEAGINITAKAMVESKCIRVSSGRYRAQHCRHVLLGHFRQAAGGPRTEPPVSAGHLPWQCGRGCQLPSD